MGHKFSSLPSIPMKLNSVSWRFPVTLVGGFNVPERQPLIRRKQEQNTVSGWERECMSDRREGEEVIADAMRREGERERGGVMNVLG